MVKKLKLKESNSNGVPTFGKSEYTSLISKKYLNGINAFIRGCQKIADFVNQHSEILYYTDAKLYDVFSEFDDVDEFFLQIEWDNFEEFCNENDIEIENVRNSSSKFYLNDSEGYIECIRDFTETDRRGNIYDVTYMDIADAVARVEWGAELDYTDIYKSDEALNDWLQQELYDNYENPENDLDETAKYIVDICEETEDIFNMMETGDMSATVIEYLQSVVDAYMYIDTFKANQIEYYQDYVDENELEY